MGEHIPVYSHAGYLGNFIRLDRLAKVIEASKIVLAKYDFDSIACTGVSGMLIGPTLAMAMGKTLIVVRKEKADGNNCHSYDQVEGDRGARRYIIADDCVDTGSTSKEVLEQIGEWSPQAVCLGTLEAYHLYSGTDASEFAEYKLCTRWMPEGLRPLVNGLEVEEEL